MYTCEMKKHDTAEMKIKISKVVQVKDAATKPYHVNQNKEVHKHGL